MKASIMAKQPKKPQAQPKNAPDVSTSQHETVLPLGPPAGKMIVLRSVLLFASVVVILAGVKAAAAILTPVLLALFVTILLLVPLRRLVAMGFSSALAFAIVGGTILLLFLAMGWLMTHSLRDFIRNSDNYTEKMVRHLTVLETKARDFSLTLGVAIPEAPAESGGKQAAVPEEAPMSAVIEDGDVADDAEATTEHPSFASLEDMPPVPGYAELDPRLVMQWATWGAARLTHFGENLLLFLIILMFMIFEAARFPAKLEKAFGGSPITNDHFRQIVDDIRRYIVFKGLINLLSCVTVTIFYCTIGVKYALLWGLISFFLSFIPNIGTIIAAIPPVLLMFIEQSLGGVITLVVGLVIIESIIGYGIEPRLMGHGLGISTVVVFLSLIFWGWLLGPVGLILAAPLTIVAKIVLQAFDETRWIAVLLDEKIPAK